MADPSVILALVVFFVLILAGDSSARELRPSDHGLVFQTLSPAGAHSTPEMRSFFNSENSSPTTTSSSSNVALPSAINSGEASPPSWWRVAGDGDGGDRVAKALTMASLACGIAGAILLVASGLIYLYKYRKQKQNAASHGHNNGNQGETENEDNNKLQLVDDMAGVLLDEGSSANLELWMWLSRCFGTGREERAKEGKRVVGGKNTVLRIRAKIQWNDKI